MFTYFVITHLAALAPLSVSTHYLFTRRTSLHCILAFHDRAPLSPLIPYNTKSGQQGFAERAALGKHIPRTGRGFRTCKATLYKQQDVCWNDTIFQLRKISWKCGSILTNKSLLAFLFPSVCAWVKRIPPTHRNCHVADSFLRKVNCRSAATKIPRLLCYLKVHTALN